MGIVDMGSVPRKTDLASRISDLENRIAIMERTSRLSNASIGSGGLTIRDGGSIRVIEGGDIRVEDDGNLVIGQDAYLQVLSDNAVSDDQNLLIIGDLWVGVDYLGRGLVMRQRDGRGIVTFTENVAEGSSWVSLYDGGGREVIAMDRATGYGLSGPFTTVPWSNPQFPEGYSTTKNTGTNLPSPWEDLWEGKVNFVNPMLDISVFVVISGQGANGQMRLMLDGNQVYISPNFNTSQQYSTVIPLHSQPGATTSKIGTIVIQARRVTGTNSVAARPIWAYGRN